MRRFLAGKVSVVEDGRMDGYYEEGEKYRNKRNGCPPSSPKPTYAQGHLFLGEVYAHSGQKEKALEHLKEAETMFQEMGMDYWLGVTREVSAGL
jgi:hypothetical protein